MNERIFSGKYQVQDEIARGGMGVIFRALDTKLHRQVAIKILHAHFSGDPDFAERFLREARAMARLDHENIIRVHAVEEEAGAHYIVMEFFQGADLRKLIRGGRQLSLHETLNISLQVTQALDYAHGHGIIHRDIKPANVMVDSKGRAKLADFGIAAAIDEASLTATGQIIGTPEYMSPEQAKGGPLDCRSDLYSLGMLIYEMLTGRTPYHQIAKTAILGKLLYDPEELRLEFPSTVPSFLQAIVEDLLRKDPEHRTPEARIVVSQLKELLSTLPAPSISADTESTVIASTTSPDPKTTKYKSMIQPSQPSVQFSLSSDTRTQPSAKKEDLEATDILPSRRPSNQPDPQRSLGQEESEDTDILPLPKVPIPQSQMSLSRRLKTYHVLPIVGSLVCAGVVLGGIIYFLQHGSDTTAPPPKPAIDREVETPLDLPGSQSTLPGQEDQSRGRTPRTPDTEGTKRTHDERAKVDAEQQRLANNQADVEAKRKKPKQDAAAKKVEAEAGKERRHQLAETHEPERARVEPAERLKTDPQAHKEQAEQEAASKRIEDETRKERERQVAEAREAERTRAETAERLKAENRARKEQSEQETASKKAQDDTRKERERQVAEARKSAAVHDQQLQALIKNFKTAYENRDFDALEAFSDMNQARVRNVELMFENYSTIGVSVHIAAVTDEEAMATLTYDKLVKPTGEVVTLQAIARTIKIRIKKEGNEWKKIVW
jgi:serine/threonine protein kinase